MGNGMDKILPGLYVGNLRDSQNKQKLDDHDVTHILSIHDTAKKIHPEKKYLCINASDNAGQELTQYFSQTTDFIHGARLGGDTVMVHCLAGVSRSVTVTVAYIMTSTDLGWRDALNAVRGIRRCANPNWGFQKQLMEFETVLLEKERERFNEKFPNNPLRESDIKKCQQLLVIHRDWVLHGDKTGDPNKDLYPLPYNAYKQGTTQAYSSKDTEGKQVITKRGHNATPKEVHRQGGVFLDDEYPSSSTVASTSKKDALANMDHVDVSMKCSIKDRAKKGPNKQENDSENNLQEMAFDDNVRNLNRTDAQIDQLFNGK